MIVSTCRCCADKKCPLGGNGDVYTHVWSTGVHTKFQQLIVDETISAMNMLVHVPYYLETILSHVILDVSVHAYWGPQYFNTLHGEHIRSEILRNVLKAWVVLQKNLKNLSPIT